MRIEDIKKLAQLSRLELNQDELDGLVKDFESILGYISEIKEAAYNNNVEVRENSFTRNVFRADLGEHVSGEHTEALLENAPDKFGNYIKVRQVFE